MARSKKHFEEFQAHSLLKHAVLTTYLEAWARIMLLRRGATSTICIVDACAGAGMDSKGNPGSPLLAARVAKGAENHLHGDERLRNKLAGRARILLTAIEKDRKRCTELAENLAAFGDRVRVVHGTLDDYIDEHFAAYDDTPTLFFIDPFGLSPLRADVIRSALSGPHNEVLLLFADQAALRHFGAIAAIAPDLETEVAARLSAQRSLFETPEEIEAKIRAEVEVHVSERVQGQETNRAAAIEILNAAYGGEWWLPVIEATPQPERRTKFIELYRTLLLDLGATRVLTLPMRNERDRHVYSLLFATRSVRGYTKMKEAVSQSLNKAPLPDEALDSIRFQIRTDLDSVEAAVRQRFAGKTAPWTDEALGKPTIRDFALENTEVFPFELKALKQRLRTEKRRGRGPETYAFPALTNA